MQASMRRTIPKLIKPLSDSLHSAQFHSTPILLDKSKKNKAQIRFAVREKRADAKSALKDFLIYGKSSKHLNKDDCFKWTDEPKRRNANSRSSPHEANQGSQRSEKSKADSSADSRRRKHKSWQRKQQLYDLDDDIDAESAFKSTLGGQKCYTWSFTWTENLETDYKSTDFNLGGDESKEEKTRKKFWNESDEEEEPPADVGFRSHRITLGLPPTGPLKLDDIKSAFRASALKWHPDKHQGPSQVVATEKFKLCVTAYNSLSAALKPT